MPIEQVQKLLGHTKIDTTLHYALANQMSAKISAFLESILHALTSKSLLIESPPFLRLFLHLIYLVNS